jgi:hypothetical protein
LKHVLLASVAALYKYLLPRFSPISPPPQSSLKISPPVPSIQDPQAPSQSKKSNIITNPTMNVTYLLLGIALLAAPTLAGKDKTQDKTHVHEGETSCKNNDKYCEDSPGAIR